jgi:hypothetical protein
MKEAAHESLFDENCEEAGLWCQVWVCGFSQWKLGYTLPLMTIRPQFLNGSNEAVR